MNYQHQHNIGFMICIKNWCHWHFTYQELVVYIKIDDIKSLYSEIDRKKTDDCWEKFITKIEETSDLLYVPMAKKMEEWLL